MKTVDMLEHPKSMQLDLDRVDRKKKNPIACIINKLFLMIEHIYLRVLRIIIFSRAHACMLITYAYVQESKSSAFKRAYFKITDPMPCMQGYRNRNLAQLCMELHYALCLQGLYA